MCRSTGPSGSSKALSEKQQARYEDIILYALRGTGGEIVAKSDSTDINPRASYFSFPRVQYYPAQVDGFEKASSLLYTYI